MCQLPPAPLAPQAMVMVVRPSPPPCGLCWDAGGGGAKGPGTWEPRELGLGWGLAWRPDHGMGGEGARELDAETYVHISPIGMRWA